MTKSEIADIITTYISAQNKNLEDNYKQLKEIESLDDNWDTEGAKAVNVNIINSVRRLLPFLLYQPDIFPTPDGTIQLEWASKNLKHLNVEIIDETHMTVTEIHNNFRSIHTYPIDSSILNNKIKDLFKGQFEPF